MKIKELAAEDIKNIMMDRALIVMLVFMTIGITIIEPSLLRIRVSTDILTQSAARMIRALGLTLTLLLGGTDLFDGRRVGLATVMAASLSRVADCSNKFWPGLPEFPIVIPVIMTLVLVAVVGAINGSMITRLKMASFIATFGMSTIVYGTNYLYFAKKPNNSQPIGGIGDTLVVLGSFKVFGQISLLVIIAIIAIVEIQFLLNKTVFRKSIYIVGGNLEAVEISGINVGKVIIAVFIIESIFVGLTGILEVARTGGTNSAYENAYEFDTISSCVVKDVPLSGGVGKAFSVIIGVLIFTFISYGLAYIGVDSNWQLIVGGLIVYNAVALDMRKNS